MVWYFETELVLIWNNLLVVEKLVLVRHVAAFSHPHGSICWNKSFRWILTCSSSDWFGSFVQVFNLRYHKSIGGSKFLYPKRCSLICFFRNTNTCSVLRSTKTWKLQMSLFFWTRFPSRAIIEKLVGFWVLTVSPMEVAPQFVKLVPRSSPCLWIVLLRWQNKWLLDDLYDRIWKSV